MTVITLHATITIAWMFHARRDHFVILKKIDKNFNIWIMVKKIYIHDKVLMKLFQKFPGLDGVQGLKLALLGQRPLK